MDKKVGQNVFGKYASSQSGKLFVILISFAYQKYTSASCGNGKSIGNTTILKIIDIPIKHNNTRAS